MNPLNESAKKWLDHRLGKRALEQTMAYLTDAVELDAQGPQIIDTFGNNIFHAAVCFVDLSGFSDYCRDHEPKEISEHVNDFFQPVITLAKQNFGIIDKTIGDELLVFFPNMPELTLTKLPSPTNDGALRSIQYVKEVLQSVGDKSVKIGIAVGSVVLSEVGNDFYKETTLYGNSVNLAKRLISQDIPEQKSFFRFGYALCEYKHEKASSNLDNAKEIFIVSGCKIIESDKQAFKGVGEAVYISGII